MKVSEMIEIMQIDSTEIFRRADLRQIRSFILDSDSTELYDLTYNERLTEGCREMLKRLNKVYKDDENGLDDAMCDYTAAALTYRDVFAEIGMKIGARLTFQLLFENE